MALNTCIIYRFFLKTMDSPTVPSNHGVSSLGSIDRTVSRDRVLGMLYGHAIGDASGMPFEFKVGDYPIYDGVLRHHVKRYKNRFSSDIVYHPVGMVSDDTGMTLTLLKSIMASGGHYSKDNIIYMYMVWANGDLDGTTSAGMGKNTALLFKQAYKRDGPVRYHTKWYELFGNTNPSTWTQSNGSLMRCSPIALFDSDSFFKILQIDCMLSNPHYVNIDCSNVYGMTLYMAIRGYNHPEDTTHNTTKDPQSSHVDYRETIWNTIQQYAQSNEVKDVLARVERLNVFVPEGSTHVEALISTLKAGTNYDIVGKSVKGHVLRALYCAMLCLKKIQGRYLTYKEIIDTFSAIPDTDTDTNAAIAGALAGALEGFQTMMSDEITKYNCMLVSQVNGINYQVMIEQLLR